MAEEKEEKEKKEKKKEEELNFDLGVGKISLGGFFKGLESLIDLAGKIAEKGGGIREEGEIKGLGKDVRGVYGFSIRTLAGRPVIEHFGNIRETPKGPVVEEEREPMVDVFDEKDFLRVVAEVPGVEKEDIKVDLKDEELQIKAERGTRKYSKTVTLPRGVDASTLTSTYKNGVLEIKVGKPAGK